MWYKSGSVLKNGVLVFDNVKVPAKNILIGEGMGAFVLMRGLNSERLLGTAMPLGIMQGWESTY